jgi:hypothetical protein
MSQNTALHEEMSHSGEHGRSDTDHSSHGLVIPLSDPALIVTLGMDLVS